MLLDSLAPTSAALAQPAGTAIEGCQPPLITPAHLKTLRHLFAIGRPAHLPSLTGLHLDLMVHGFIESVSSSSAAAVVVVTRRGVAYLSDARQAKIASQQPHHELGKRLAAYLQEGGFWTWNNVEFANPSMNLEERTWGVARPDVYASQPTLKARNARTAIYEVKVSRADFHADVARPEKREAYAALAEAVYYCCPDGLVRKDEVPESCGLLCEIAPGKFEIKKKARRRKGFAVPADVAMTLMVKRQIPLQSMDP